MTLSPLPASESRVRLPRNGCRFLPNLARRLRGPNRDKMIPLVGISPNERLEGAKNPLRQFSPRFTITQFVAGIGDFWLKVAAITPSIMRQKTGQYHASRGPRQIRRRDRRVKGPAKKINRHARRFH